MWMLTKVVKYIVINVEYVDGNKSAKLITAATASREC